MGQTRPIPADLSRYYEVRYRGHRHGFSAEYCVRRRLRWVHQIAGEAKQRKLLDIGCGEGTFLLRARERGWDATGTELEPEAARSHGLHVVRSLSEISGADSFDCVTLWHTLEHMPDPAQVLGQAVALLKPGGTLMLAVPDAGGWQAKIFGDAWLHWDVPRHLYHFSQLSLRRLLERCGVRTIRSWHQEFEYDLLGWSQSALNRMFPTHSVFFDVLRGEARHRRFWQRATHSLAGLLAAGAALPLLPLATLFRRGGSLIVAATKP